MNILRRLDGTGLGELARLCRPAVGPIIAAGIYLVVIFLVEGLLPPANRPDDGILSMVSTLLATIIGFLGVATLSVAVSVSLVQVIVERYEGGVVGLVIDDAARNLLMKLIAFSFLTSLIALTVVSFGLIRPWLAAALPILLSALTISLLVGYVYERIAMFRTAGLVDVATRRLSSLTRRIVNSEGKDVGAKLVATDLALGLIRVGKSEIEAERLDEARVALLGVVRALTLLDEASLGAKKPADGDIEIIAETTAASMARTVSLLASKAEYADAAIPIYAWAGTYASYVCKVNIRFVRRAMDVLREVEGAGVPFGPYLDAFLERAKVWGTDKPAAVAVADAFTAMANYQQAGLSGEVPDRSGSATEIEKMRMIARVVMDQS